MSIYRKFIFPLNGLFLAVLCSAYAQSSILYSDDFESDFGNWSNVSVGDNKTWSRLSGSTTSNETGPATGADNSNFYVYLETSSGSAYTTGDTAILQGPDITGTHIHLTFQYHMYGVDIGTLAVDVLADGAWINDVWSISGQQQRSHSEAYTTVDVDLSAYAVARIRIRATAAGGYAGDIAIDNLEVSTTVDPNDLDNDGVLNAVDQCPNTPDNETANDNGCSPSQVDSDGDGVFDSDDAFPLDSTEWLDTDADGTGNNADTDDDADGILDVTDAFPLDSTEWLDTDGDGQGNNADTDDDNDGVLDSNDTYPLINLGNLTDTDGDGAPDQCDQHCLDSGMAADSDDDNDGVGDAEEQLNGTDPLRVDTDADGWNDGIELICKSDGSDGSSRPVDSDTDQVCDYMDLDVDGNGLIEIYSLDDLDSIRNQPDGKGLHGSTLGCSNCRGFELQNHLDFDENQDGSVDGNDHAGKFWNDGLGWLPLPFGDDDFDGVENAAVVFDGNGFEIQNLAIYGQPDAVPLGLFGHISAKASVINLTVTCLSSVTCTPAVVPASIDFVAWVGTNNTEVTFNPTANTYDFYRSTEKNCDLDNYVLCANGQKNLIGLSGKAIDTALLENRVAYYTLKDSVRTSETLTASFTRFSKRSKPEVIYFNGKMWVIGGWDSSGHRNDIWSSVDGVNWIQEVAAAPFSPRREHQIVEFQSKLWLIAGNDGSFTNDVWSSVDGINWVEETSAAQFLARYEHQVVVFENKLWLLGGFGMLPHEGGASSHKFNDVWSSADGVTWVEETAAAAFSGRRSHESLVFDNKIWIIGGWTDSTSLTNDVWSSVDGINWVEMPSAQAFSVRSGHNTIVFNNKMWVVGGKRYEEKNDVWSSADGIAWTQDVIAAEFSGRTDVRLLVKNDRLWLIGGSDGNSLTNQIWSSNDGVSWKEETLTLQFLDRFHHSTLVYNDELFLIGGDTGPNLKDVWSSADGVNWNEQTSNAAFGPRLQHQSVVFDNKMWVIGGSDGFSSYSDTWYSENGKDWLQATAAAGFASRSTHQSLVFDNKIWVIGGYTDTFVNDVWYSSNGIDWTQATASAGFAPRSGHQSIVFDNRIWVVGGRDGSSSFNDVWYSENGIDWFEATPSAAFFARSSHQLAIFNHKMWLFGGTVVGSPTTRHNDIWSSVDGVNWTEATSSPAFDGRSSHQVINFDNKLLLIGGYITGFASSQHEIWSSSDGIEWRKPFRGTISFP